MDLSAPFKISSSEMKGSNRLSRREFLGVSACGMALAGLTKMACANASTNDSQAEMPIVDTHQHLWDLDKINPPWLAGASEKLRQRATNVEYREATRGLNVLKAIYMEVDMAPKDHVAEAEQVIALCQSKQHPTIAAVIGGRPASSGFASYIKRFKDVRCVKGVRQVLFGQDAADSCLQTEFIRGLRWLGDAGLSFDICLSVDQLHVGVKLVDECPGTRFIVDHCGNADPMAFLKISDGKVPSHNPEIWKRNMAQLAQRTNVICKISGIVARVGANWKPEDLTPVIHHCLEVFGPDRVVFGGDWPVCLTGATYRQWVMALREIISSQPIVDQRKLWYDNAVRVYGLE
jgi:L-fuconolactonase